MTQTTHFARGIELVEKASSSTLRLNSLRDVRPKSSLGTLYPKSSLGTLRPVDSCVGLVTGPGDDIVDKCPDGGLQAWTVALGSWCLLLVSAGWINCIGIFQEQYEQHDLSSYSSSALAWIPSLETFVMFGNGILAGKLYDTFGPFYLVLGGTVLHVFGVMMISLGKEYYQILLAQGVCSPLGASLLFYSALNATTTWFERRRALALGFVVGGASVGGVVLPIMMQQLIPRIGFKWSLRAVGFLMLGLCMVAQLTVRSRVPPTPKPLSAKEFVHPLKEFSFLMLTIGSALFFWGMFVPFNYVIVQAEAAGMPAELAEYLVAVLNGTSLFGRILPGYLGDRVGRFNTLVIMSTFSGILTLGLWLPGRRSVSALIAFAALYGFASGAFVSLAPACVAQISPLNKIGVRQGVYFACISWAALTGNPIAGAIRGAQGGAFEGLQAWTGGCLIFGSLLLGVSRWGVAERKIGFARV